MPTRAEINFIEMWTEHAQNGVLSNADANEWSDANPNERGEIVGGPSDTMAPRLISHHGQQIEWKLTPRGADLITTAKIAGIPEVADDEIPLREATPATVKCPDCKGDGEIGIPIEYGAHGGILRVWPSKCEKCGGKGSLTVHVGMGFAFEHIQHDPPYPPESAGDMYRQQPIRANHIVLHGSSTDGFERIEFPSERMLLGDLFESGRHHDLVGKIVELRDGSGLNRGRATVTRVGKRDGDPCIFTDHARVYAVSNVLWTVRVADESPPEWREFTSMDDAASLVGRWARFERGTMSFECTIVSAQTTDDRDQGWIYTDRSYSLACSDGWRFRLLD